jgi:hypothetical protein
MNPHTCSLKHLSFIDETAILSRHMRDKNFIVKAHKREIEKHRVKFDAFFTFTMYFFPLFFTHLGFLIVP